MLRKRILDTIFSIFLLIGSIYLWFMADAFPKLARYKGIDSDFWPKMILVVIGVIAFILCSQNLIAFCQLWMRSGRKETGQGYTSQKATFDRQKFVLITGLVALYFIGLQTIGFLISTFVFLFLGMCLVGYSNRVVRVIYPLIFTLLLGLIFTEALSLPLPRGIGFFETFSRWVL